MKWINNPDKKELVTENPWKDLINSKAVVTKKGHLILIEVTNAVGTKKSGAYPLLDGESVTIVWDHSF